MTWETIVDELLETPCWIIDILPERVERGSQGQYFSIEKYYLEEPRLWQYPKRADSYMI